jgi:hypothetical protein
MTQDEIIKIATQVYGKCDWHESALTHLESFAKLVAAKAIAELESQEPVAIVTGDAWETDIRFLPEGMALPPDTKLYTHPQRTWVGLEQSDMPDSENPMFDHKYFIAGMVFASNILEEKNT